MIDFHTHLLPRIDDGAKDMATAVAMLEAERAQGVTTVVLTPHFYGIKRSPQQFLQKRAEIAEQLQARLPQGTRIRLGAEVHFTGMSPPSYEDICRLAIEGTNYVLLELPFEAVWRKNMVDVLSDFIYETGYTPIIAHVERYREVRKKPAILTELMRMGCLLQVNARSFVDKRDKQFAFALLKKGMVHCIGSDAHDEVKRPPDMSEGKRAVEKAGLSLAWERVQDIMDEVLQGGQVRVECGKPLKKIFGKYR